MNALKTETEAKIIAAARDIFIEKGLDGARMQEIADRAGINKALLHYYFRSKDKLFDAVFEETFHKIIPEFVSQINKGETAFDLMKTFVTFYNDFFLRNPYTPQFFFHEIWQHPDKVAEFIKSQNVRLREIIGIANAQLPKVYETEFLAQHMMANVMGMCLFPHIGRPLYQRLLFDNDEKAYNKFLAERTDFLLKMLDGLVSSEEGNSNEAPDENF
jgi:TetR/AcrR family transcriptional regulator